MKFKLNISIILFVAFTCFSCYQSDQTKRVNGLLTDTTNLINKDYRFDIDTINSGLTTRKFESKTLSDSIIIFFDADFRNTPITLIYNKSILIEDTLNTDPVLGHSKTVILKRDKCNNLFDLRINQDRYQFIETNKYNFIHIAFQKKKLWIIYTNKKYFYE